MSSGVRLLKNKLNIFVLTSDPNMSEMPISTFHITYTQPPAIYPEGWDEATMITRICQRLDRMGLLEHQIVPEFGQNGTNPHFAIVATGSSTARLPNKVKRAMEEITGQCRAERGNWPKHLRDHFVVVKESKMVSAKEIWLNYGNKEGGKQHICGFKQTYLQQAARNAEKSRIIAESSRKKTKFLSDGSCFEEMVKFMVEEAPHEKDWDKLRYLMTLKGYKFIFVRLRKHQREEWRAVINKDGGEMLLAYAEDEIPPHLRNGGCSHTS